jgi:DNA (cytosine-5)-methyltransferase 1
MRVIYYVIPEIVEVRKYEVDIKGLQKCLKEHKTKTIREIAEQMKLPKTDVEHWFRSDKYFAIPRAEIWQQLKNILNIKTKKYDKSIMTFTRQLGVHDQSNRVYDVNGIAPTLTSTNSDIRIIFT